MPEIIVRIATTVEIADCFDVRREVFVVGQDVPEEEEIDGLDEQCVHVIALADGKAIATARMRKAKTGEAKIERVAVLEAYRGRDVGKRIMDVIEQEARTRGFKEAILGAQIRVLGFYESRGYVTEGEEFMDANIPHLMMRLSL